VTASPPHGDRGLVHAAIAILLSVGLTFFVLVALFPNLWYGLHDISDIPLYHSYAERLAAGEIPFTDDFPIEYPPLAVPILQLPGHTDDVNAYITWFTISMGVLTMAAAALTAYAACCVWPRGGTAYNAAVLFPIGVALTGAIIVNRYDVAVALVLAAFLICLVRRWYTLAALVLGIGFALKFTPLAILPLVLVMAGPARRWLWPIVAFSAAAIVPFVRYLLNDPGGIWYVFRYHLERPLQIESVLGTPMLLAQLLGTNWVTVGFSHGSHSLSAPGAHLAASASGGLTLLAVVAAYGLVWRRRESIRRAPAEQVLAVLALVVALMAFSKVLSPQYVVWILPAWAIVAASDYVLGLLGGLVLLLTQIEFPSMYWSLLQLQDGSLAVVVLRNVVLLIFLAACLWRLARLPNEARQAGLSAEQRTT
jgi:hypothetical protein